MNHSIEKITKFRVFLLKQIEGLSTDELNRIPPKFNNNIIWNLGHVIYAQQNMCYIKANLPMAVDQKYFAEYMSGTKPERFIEARDVKTVKDIFISSMTALQEDFDKNIFENYSPSPAIHKVYGFEINNISDALEYLLYHEGLHAGSILALKRAL